MTEQERRDAKAQAWRRLCEKTAALGVAFAEFDTARNEYAFPDQADRDGEGQGERG